MKIALTNLLFVMLFLSSGAAFAQSSNLAAMDARIAQLEAEIRRLTGQLEEQSFKLRKLEGDVNRKLSDAELRISDVERNNRQPTPPTTSTYQPSPADPSPWQNPAPAPRPQVEPQTNTLGQIGAPPGNNATAQYEAAFSTLRSGDYDRAEQQFQAFLDRYPNTNLTENARYWLAETYYVRNQYDQAAQSFAKAYQSAPRGSKAPDNLLKLGLSLAGLGKTGDACVAFDQLLLEYESGPRAIINRAARERDRLACS